jgi:hypothetical protein
MKFGRFILTRTIYRIQEVKVRVMLRLTISRSVVRLGVDAHLDLMTGY